MKKKLYVVAALVLTLVLSGGVFGGTWFSDANSGTITTAADFVNVSSSALTIADVQGGESDNISAKTDLFTVDPDAGFTGDLLLTVYLTNAPELTSTFESLQLKVKADFQDAGAGLELTDTQILSLFNEEIIIPITSYGSANITVDVDGGTFHAMPGLSAASVDIGLYCEVTQRGNEAGS